MSRTITHTQQRDARKDAIRSETYRLNNLPEGDATFQWGGRNDERVKMMAVRYSGANWRKHVR